mmetsp:Transcript_7419/g.11195  ORF Transcript_7419/g.11195 Transcript_7419/m.11195 type:complete len:256 (+) Transcript_7419:638-1405(+)
MSHNLSLDTPRSPESAQEFTHIFPGLVGVLLEHVVQRGHGQVQDVNEVLGEHAQSQVAVRPDIADRGHQGPSHQLEQGGLARPVGPHQRNAGVQVHPKVHVLVQGLALGVGKGDALELQHGGGQGPGVGEPEVDHALDLHLLGEPAPHHLGQGLLLALGLAGQLGCAVTEPRNVLLHLLDLVLLPVVSLHLVLLHLGPGLHIHVVVARVVVQALAVEVHHVGAHRVHEVLGVRHHEQDLLPVGQVLLQPHHCLQV